MTSKSNPSRTLGPVSANFIATLQKRGKSIFSIQEAQALYGKSSDVTSDFLSDLIKRGILARIKPGCFLILQTGNENTQLRNWPVIARELMGKDEYYLSHQSAMRLHGMTSHPAFNIYLTTHKRKSKKTVDQITYHFIYTQEKHFWGQEAQWVTKQEQVQTSDLERTLLDGFDRPELCGGFSDVARGLWSVQNKIDLIKLTQYAKRFRSKAAVKRLGFVLEALELLPEVAKGLHSKISNTNDYVLLDPKSDKKGSKRSRWRIIENIDPKQLKQDVWG